MEYILMSGILFSDILFKVVRYGGILLYITLPIMMITEYLRYISMRESKTSDKKKIENSKTVSLEKKDRESKDDRKK